MGDVIRLEFARKPQPPVGRRRAGRIDAMSDEALKAMFATFSADLDTDPFSTKAMLSREAAAEMKRRGVDIGEPAYRP